jgi:hypothetical protein
MALGAAKNGTTYLFQAGLLELSLWKETSIDPGGINRLHGTTVPRGWNDIFGLS